MPKKKIKIIYILPLIANGGAERVLFDLLENINKEKFLVKLLCMQKSDKEFSVWQKELVDKEIEIYFAGGEDKGIFRKFYKILQTVRMIVYLKKERPDIVQTQLFMADIFGRIAARIAGVKTIITVEHSLETELSLFKRLLLKYSAKFATRIVAVSKATKNHLNGFYKINRNKIIVIYNGVEIKKYFFDRVNQKGGAVVIGAMGRLVKQKGYDFLVEALIGVKGDWKCIIAGSKGADEDLTESLKEKINRNFLEERIKLIGFQENSKKFYEDIDIFVMPSRWEAMPIVLLEAGLSALPIVATQVGGVDEAIENEESGKLFQVGDVERLRECIQSLVNSKDERKRLGDNLQQKIVEEFDLLNMVKKYEALYLELSNDYVKEHYDKEKKHAKEILQTEPFSEKRKEKTDIAYNEIISVMKKYRDGDNFGQDNVLNFKIIEKLVDKKAKILDFGCGEGELVEILNRKGYSAEGFDVAQINIDNAKKRLEKFNLFSKVRKGDINGISNKFDLIVMDNVIEHIPEDEIEKVVLKLKECLNDKGQVLVITPQAYSGPHDISGKFLPIGSKAEGFHFKEYTITELRNLFLEAGFRKIETYFINPTILNRLNIILKPNSFGLRKSVFLEKLFSRGMLKCLFKINKNLSNKMVSIMFPGIIIVKK